MTGERGDVEDKFFLFLIRHGRECPGEADVLLQLAQVVAADDDAADRLGEGEAEVRLHSSVTGDLGGEAPAVLDSIAAVMIGGASMFGGSGTVGRTLIGCLVIAVLELGLRMSGTPTFDKYILVGAILVGAVVVERYLPAGQGKGIDLEAATPREPVRIPADPGRLQQVLANLLTNAVKFTAEGGTIRVALFQPAAVPGDVVAARALAARGRGGPRGRDRARAAP